MSLVGFVGWLPFNWFGCLTGWFPDDLTGSIPITDTVFYVHNLPSQSQSNDDKNIDLQNLLSYTSISGIQNLCRILYFNDGERIRKGTMNHGYLKVAVYSYSTHDIHS